jgi:hypothetical protein
MLWDSVRTSVMILWLVVMLEVTQPNSPDTQEAEKAM